MAVIYEDMNIKIEIEESEIPWLKIFTQLPFKEMSELPKEFRYEIYDLINIIEEEMITYFNPKKINIAEFGNYLPHLHWHIMARFEEDSSYPEPIWGEKQREANLDLPSLDIFYENLHKKLKSL